MKQVSKKRRYSGRAHLPALKIRCLRAGPCRAFGAVAARQLLCLRRGHTRAALKRNSLWRGWARICIEKENHSFYFKSSRRAPQRGEITVYSFNLHHKRFRCKAARARPCPKSNARRAAMASHTHFFRRKKAARRAYGRMRLSAALQTWGSVISPCKPIAYPLSAVGLRPLGLANSPRVFWKRRSHKPHNLRH